MDNTKTQIKIKIIQELYEKVGSDRNKIHRLVCEMAGIDTRSVNVVSTYNKVVRVVSKIKEFKRCKNVDKLTNYLESNFEVPEKTLKRQSPMKYQMRLRRDVI